MTTSPLRDFWNSPRLMRRIAGVLIGLSLLSLTGLISHWMANRPVFVVKRVIVDTPNGGLKVVSSSQIHAAVAEALNGTLLSTDLKAVHQALQSIPWVKSVSVRRIWPNRLLVRIEEQQAVGTWGQGRLVNHVGEVFVGAAADHEDDCRLIPLFGPAGSHALVLERARQLTQWLEPVKLSLVSLTLSEQYAWTAELSGGVTLELGRDSLATPVEERVRMFVRTQPWLHERLAAKGEQGRLVRADLRYAIGYAFQTSSPATGTATTVSEPLCIGVHT
jgi:cell division protein FtsQ